MGTINDGAMKNWENGDVVTEALYEADREMLRVAINDNFARLMKSITVLNADGSTKTTKNMDTAFNFLKVKDGTGITLSMDGVGTVTIAASPAAASVNTAALQDGSVLTVKLADGSVTTIKLAAGSVTTDKMVDGSVTNAKIADASITTVKIADGSVTGVKLDPAIATNSPQVEAHNGDVNAHVSIRTSITNHTGNTSNPHNVTAAQIGALAASAYTAADVLAKIKTVDGGGSGLDADLLDGANSSTSGFANTIALRDGLGALKGTNLIADNGQVSVLPASGGEARYHLYNGGGAAEWKFGQKAIADHDFKISKVVAGVNSDYFSVTSDGNVTVPVGNLIYRGEAIPGLRSVAGGYMQMWDGGQWKSPGNAHVITLFSSATGVQNAITTGSYNPTYTTIGGGYSGSFDEYQFFVDDAVATGRTCYFEINARMDSSSPTGVVRLRDPNDSTVFVDLGLSGTTWQRIRSGSIGTYIGGHTLHIQMLNNGNHVQIKSLKLIFI